MALKGVLRKIILKILIFLKKDFDISRQRLIFHETLRKNVQDMDKVQLGQLIRFFGHSLDKSTKCENKSEKRGEERKKILVSALNEWQKRKYSLGPDKVWAAKIVERHDLWCSGEKNLIETVRENHVPIDNDVFSVIRERRSTRFWKKKIVEREKIEKIIAAATYSPSSCNRMPWHIFVVENNLNNVIKGDSTNQSLLEKAPVIIYLGIDERLYPEVYAPALDAGIALQSIVLAAHALEVSSCLMYQCESIDQKKLKKSLNIDDYYRIYCAVLLGYPDEIPLTPGRITVEEVSTFLK